MSFTVSRQKTEIGIRVALGANPRRIIWSTLSRALVQVGLGLAVGIVPALAVVTMTGREVVTGRASGAIVTLAVLFMLAVTMAACAVPARRALRIQPTDALKTP
jgi:ABC-type antimicrobial peptide transport system permease subunit